MESKTSERKLKRIKRIQTSWKLRLAGHNLSEIARATGVDVGTACRDIKEAYESWQKECALEAAETARLDLARLDALLAALWTQALMGDTKSVTAALKVLEQRAKITGHYTPIKIEQVPSTSPDELEAELLKKLDQLK